MTSLGTLRAAAFVAAALIVAAVPHEGAAQADLPHLSHLGVELIAVPAKPGARLDVPILAAQQGLENLRAALDVLMRRSPLNAQAIETLKQSGRVIIVYEPRHPPPEATVDGIAAFFPYFFRNREDGSAGDFLVVVGRHGIKWPASELAAVLAHELAGHGMQRHRGERETMRMLDRECEAQLYQEKALQDLGVDKGSQFVVKFRRELENHYCADFRRFQRQHRPDTLRLWEARNPDVVGLLTVFREHLRNLRATGGTAGRP